MQSKNTPKIVFVSMMQRNHFFTKLRWYFYFLDKYKCPFLKSFKTFIFFYLA
jgi:hypothetical protein